jgi:hypothetical protein
MPTRNKYTASDLKKELLAFQPGPVSKHVQILGISLQYSTVIYYGIFLAITIINTSQGDLCNA